MSLGLAALTWAALADGPLKQSPTGPLPYNWSTFHSGGVDSPDGDPVVPTDPLDLRSDVANGMGTPTERVPVTINGAPSTIRTQVPSFLLGNVDQNNPLDPDLTGLANNVLPSRYYNFRQSDLGGSHVYEWFSPFVYDIAAPSATTDDNDGLPNFSPVPLAAPWTRLTNQGTAINAEDIYAAVVKPKNGVAATWILPNTVAGNYYVTAHIPSLDKSAATGVNDPAAVFSTDAHYTVKYTSTTGAAVTQSVRAIQQSGDITLIGPVGMRGSNVTVTLDNGTNLGTVPSNTYVLGDSVSLVPANVTQTWDDKTPSTPGWSVTSGVWTTVTTTAPAVPALNSIALTATNQQYHRIVAAVNGNRVSKWTFTVPASTFYSAAFHIPDSVAGVTPSPESRVTDAHYVITVRHIVSAGPPVVATTTTVVNTRISQTEANSSQPVGSAFYAQAGDTVVVSLDNSSNTIPASNAANTYVIADSMSLTPSNGADVSGSAVAVVGDPNTDDPNAYDATLHANGTKSLVDYPEIGDAYYYGPQAGTVNTIDTTPHGYGTPGNVTTIPDNNHKIRSLVYFGRRETGVDANNRTFVRGSMYCVDGMTGSVVWMFRAPALDHKSTAVDHTGSAVATTWNDGDTSILSSPAVARLNVVTGFNNLGAPIYATKLCVVFSDNNGRVFCLDAIGNRDGKGLEPTGDGFTPVSSATAVSAGASVGTTTAYWIFRPDPTRPKITSGTDQGKLKPSTSYDPNSDMPAPGAFGTAAPVIFVDRTVSQNLDTLHPGSTGALVSQNAVIYVGNSNGVLYALDAQGGVHADTDPAATNANTDTYYHTLPYVIPDPANAANPPLTDTVMTTHCRWWYSIRGPVASPVNNAAALAARNFAARLAANNAAQRARSAAGATAAKGKASARAARSKASNRPAPRAVALAPHATDTTSATSNADIESAPALFVNPSDSTKVTIIFGSAHEQEATSNIGRLYAVRDSLAGAAGWNGPVGNSGKGDTSGVATNPAPVGYLNYNIDQGIEWEFPQLHTKTGTTYTLDPRDGLGNITGSPVIFHNPVTGTNAGTWLYVAANSGPEILPGNTAPAIRPAEDAGGRIWCVNPVDGKMKWAYPAAIDPNIKPGVPVGTGTSPQDIPEPSAPMGSFLHATPAVGMVTFPTHIQYLTALGTVVEYTHADQSNADIKGQMVPMLYVGCRGQLDNHFYALDLDAANSGAATDDKQHFIYSVPSPSGADFQSSVALITNGRQTTAPYIGPGGMVYCSSGGNLYQFSATPLSNGNVLDSAGNPQLTQAFPQITVDQFNGFGPVSSASLAAMDVSDISGVVAPALTVQDWLYCGDSASGFMHAMTPRTNAAVGGGVDVGGFLPSTPPNPNIPKQQITLRETLHIHVVDGTSGHDPASTNITTSENPIGGTLPLFEWGDNAYFRFTNVVPPNPGDATAALRITTLGQQDQQLTSSGAYLTNGSPISFQISDYDFDGNFNGTNDGGVVNNYNDPNIAASPATIDPNFNGFSARSDTSTDDPLTSATKSYFAAYAYALRDGTGRMNTPGSRRKIINARQTAEIHTSDGALAGTVTLESTYVTTGAKVINSPTFGILNPIAEQGGGLSLTEPSANTLTFDNQNSIGPFPVTGNLPSSAVTARNIALTNGNLYIAPGPGNSESTLPKNGDDGTGINSDPTAPPASGTLNTSAKAYKLVYTATQLLNHNSSGANAAAPFAGGPFYDGHDYGLHVIDRSNLYKNGQQLNIAMERTALRWNDPITLQGGATTVNRLPWDMVPVSWNAGINTSLDYPDMRRGDLAFSLLDYLGNASDIGDSPGGAPISQVAPASPVRYPNLPIKMQVDVPQYQPANLAATAHATGQFADGYHNRTRIFVDTNRNGHWDVGEAYRDVDVQSGVSVDMGTDIVENTADVGPEAHGFGIQTGGDTNLGSFDPFNAKYQSAFIPLTVHSTGNVNLLNVQFNQRLRKLPFNGSAVQDTLKMLADSTDALSVIPAYDLTALTEGGTGISGPGPNYLIRSSLDPDLVAAHANQPLLATGAAPGFTFHKSRVGDTSPAVLRVPDTPHDNFGAFSFNYGAGDYRPRVGVAVPYGTPAGSYSRLIRVFEGSDPVQNPLVPPTYSQNVHWLDVVQPNAGDLFRAMQTSSISGTIVHVNVTENRVTNGSTFGSLPQVDAKKNTQSPNYTPAAYRDLRWDGNGKLGGSGNINLYWTASRPAGAFAGGITSILGTDIFGYTLPYQSPSFNPADPTGQWYKSITADPLGSIFAPSTLSTTSYTSLSIATDPEGYDTGTSSFFGNGTSGAFYTRITGTPGAYSTTLTYAPITNTATGALGTAVELTGSAPVYHPRGVYWGNVPWVFWHTGGRGGTRIYYSYVIDNGGTPKFTEPQVLPVPASLSSVSDAIPNVIGDFETPPGPARSLAGYLEVTYSAVAPDGHQNIYVSRFGTYQKTGSSNLSLQLTPAPTNNEFLQPDTSANWWYARDTGWLRDNFLDISIKVGSQYYPILHQNPLDPAPIVKPKLDTASGILVFPNVPMPGQSGIQPTTIYMDLAGGRVRFYPALPVIQGGQSLYATFSSLSRKITTDLARPSTDPVSFLDNAFKSNNAGGRVQADRYWFIFHKAAPAGVNKAPTLYYKTQRLMVAVSDTATNKPLPFPLTSGGMPDIQVKDAVTGGIYYDTSDTKNRVDVDWQRGRIYFPITTLDKANNKYVDSEGRPVVVTFTAANGNAVTYSDTVRWSDELMGSDNATPPPAGSVAGNASTNEQELPIHNPVNEGSVTAFLDPFAFANSDAGSYQVFPNTPAFDQPHTVWLYWTSTRNGQSDIYSMTVNPKFEIDAAQ